MRRSRPIMLVLAVLAWSAAAGARAPRESPPAKAAWQVPFVRQGVNRYRALGDGMGEAGEVFAARPR